MSELKILCVYNDGVEEKTRMIGLKGLSLLLDIDDNKILFDVGRRGRVLLWNLSSLNVEPNSISKIILSHSSPDCVGGLDGFLTDIQDSIEVYANDSVWNTKTIIFSFLTSENEEKIVKKPIDDWVQVSNNLFISPPFGENKESVLVITSKKGAIVISAGCKDILPIVLKEVYVKFGKIYGFVGGLHLKKLKQNKVQEIANLLVDEYSIEEIILNGCADRDGIENMRVATSIKTIKDFFVGQELKFEVN